MSDKEAFIQSGRIIEKRLEKPFKIRSLFEIMEDQKKDNSVCNDQDLIDNLYYSIGMALEIPKLRQKEIDVYLLNLLHEKKVISKSLWQIFYDYLEPNECIYSLYMYGIMVSENNKGVKVW